MRAAWRPKNDERLAIRAERRTASAAKLRHESLARLSSACTTQSEAAPPQSKMKTLDTIALISLCLLAGNLIAPGAPPTRVANTATTLLTYPNTVSFFKAAKSRATEVQPRCTIFFEGEWKNANIYDYCVIMVENSDQDVQVTFYLTDAHEMNWVTEFLDSQFFTRSETEQLFRLMNSNRDVRGQNVGCFRVDVHHWQPRHAEIFVFSFTPSSRRG